MANIENNTNQKDILNLSLTQENIRLVLSIISGSPKKFSQIVFNSEDSDIKRQTFDGKSIFISNNNWQELKNIANDIQETINKKTENYKMYTPFTGEEPNFFLNSDIKFLMDQKTKVAKTEAKKIGKQVAKPIKIKEQEINFNELLYFLQTVTEKQRRQEEAYLKNRLLLLSKQGLLSKLDKESSKEIGKLMSFLIAFEKEPIKKRDYTTFYKNLTKLLNLLTVRDKELLQTRAEQLTNKSDKTTPELLDILTKISRITSAFTRPNQVNLKDAEKEIIDQITKNNIKFKGFGDYFSFLLYYLTQQPLKNKIHIQNYPQIFNLPVDIPTENGNFSPEELLEELKRFQKSLQEEINKTSSPKKEDKENLKKVTNFIESLTTTLKNSSLLKITENQLTLYDIDEQMTKLQDSIIGILSDNSSSGRKNLADDSRLGYHNLEFGYNFDSKAMKFFDDLDNFIVSARNDRKDKRAFQKAISINNQEFKNIITNLEKLKGGFMVHETDKYYQRSFDREKFEGRAFTGRTMNIFNYITSINFILNSIGQDIDEQQLAFLTLNSYSNAVASAKKDPLEKIFSIFSGLIMFDDFVIAAKEYIQEQTKEDLQHIHLYRVDQFYFPSSYFLYQTLEFLQEQEKEVQRTLKNEIISKIDWSDYNDKENRKRKTNLSRNKIQIIKTETKSYKVTIIQPTEEENDPIWTDFTSGWVGRNIAAKKAVKIKIEFFKDFYKFLEEIFDIK